MAIDYTVRRLGLYRSRNGLFLGVCKGIADYFDVSVFWTRVLTFVTFIMTGFFPICFVYVLAALLMKKAPRYHYFDMD